MPAPPDFLEVLKASLPKSSFAQRKLWAADILEKEIPLKDLAELLKGEKEIATRFLWTISDIGIQNPSTLLKELPYLYKVCKKLDLDYATSFTSFWLYTGVPEENEAEAINVLFQVLGSPKTNVSIKGRSMLVLFKLTKKYPELKDELKLCLTEQLHMYSKDFDKRLTKILADLEA